MPVDDPVDLTEWEVIDAQVNAATHIIEDMAIRLGNPSDPLSEAGQKLMQVIVAVWQDLYPKDATEWFEARKTYQNNELTITEQVHQGTGRSLASYPYPVYQIMKKVFPEFDSTERTNCLKMVKKFPMFRFANTV